MKTSQPNIKVKVIIGSMRQNRFSEKPAQWIFEEARKLKGVEIELLDLRNYPMTFLTIQCPFNEERSILKQGCQKVGGKNKRRRRVYYCCTRVQSRLHISA